MANNEQPSPYELGAMDDEEVVGLFGPSNTLEVLNAVKAQADALDGLVRSTPDLKPDVRSTWADWYAAWDKFYKDTTDSWVSTLKLSLNETMDQAKAYKAKVDAWRTALEKATGKKVAGPRITEGESNIPWTALAYVGAGVAALVAVGYVVKAFKED